MKRDNFTKAVSAILCMAMAVSFSACNNDLNIDHTTSTNGNSTQETSETEAAATTTTTAEATEASTEDTTEASSEPVSSNPYERFIEDYKKALSKPDGTWYYGPDADFGGEQPPEGTVALPLSNVYEDSFSYMLYDVDGDGTKELIIGEQWEDGENWVHIRVFGLVTMIGDDYRIAAACRDSYDLEYKGGTHFYSVGWPSDTVKVLSVYEYNAENKCLDLAVEMEVHFKEGSNTVGLPEDAEYLYFEGKGGMERTDALATGMEAQNKYFAVRKTIGELPSDLIDREWTEVAFKTEAKATTTTTAEATEASTEDTTEASSEPVSSNPYERFIEDYRKALSNPNGTWYYGPDADFGGEQPPKGTVALPLSNVYEDSFSYMLYDVDGDGTKELIIGEQWEDGENWVHIRVFGLVTMIGDDYKIAAAGWDKHDLEYTGGNYFYADSWPSENVEDLSVYEYNAENKCLDLAFEMEIYFLEGSDKRGLPADAGYFYYEGKGGMERTDALATGTTAQKKYFAARKTVIGELPSDLIDREWTEVAFKDVNN